MLNENLKDLLEKVLRDYHNDSNIAVNKVDRRQNVNSVLSAPIIVVVHGTSGAGDPFYYSLFLKKLPDNTVLPQDLLFRRAFKKESYAYSKVYSQIPYIQQFIPKVYYCSDDLIIMENLGEAGFKMEHKNQCVGVAEAELVMKAIGTVHAATFHLRLSQGETEFDKQFSDENEDIHNNSFSKSVLQKQFQNGIDHLAYTNDPSLEQGIMKLEEIKKSDKVWETFVDLKKSDNITVLLNGDLRAENIMFRYDNKVVDSVKFVDFQGMRLGSPAIDLLNFLYSSLTVEVLNQCYDSLVAIYCQSFIHTLESLNVTKNKIPETEDLLREINSRELYGLSVVLIHVAFGYMDQKDVRNFYKKLGNNDHILQHKYEINQEFAIRLVAVVKRLISRNVL